MPKDEETWLWEWVRHEDTLFSTRANFFLVAEAMLFTAFAAVFATGRTELFLTLVATLGAVIAVLWGYMSIVHIVSTLNPIKKELDGKWELWKKIRSGRKPTAASPVIGVIIPVLICAVWILLLLLY
jgi:hypothetical protein